MEASEKCVLLLVEMPKNFDRGAPVRAGFGN